jgi:hypothetical protein
VKSGVTVLPDGQIGRFARENARAGEANLPDEPLIPQTTPTFVESYERSQVDSLRDDIDPWYPEAFL